MRPSAGHKANAGARTITCGGVVGAAAGASKRRGSEVFPARSLATQLTPPASSLHSSASEPPSHPSRVQVVPPKQLSLAVQLQSASPQAPVNVQLTDGAMVSVTTTAPHPAQ